MRWRLGGGQPEAEEPLADETVEEETEEETPADLSALDEDARAIAERYVQEQLAAERSRHEKFVAGARKRGIVLTESGDEVEVALGDIKAASDWVAPLFPVVQTPQQAQAQAQAAQEPEDPEPDANYDMAGWLQWFRRQSSRETAKLVAESTKALSEENQQLRGLFARREQSQVSREIEQLVQARAPHLAPFLSHPDFAQLYEAGLSHMTAEQLSDPQQLVALVGYTGAHLDPNRFPAPKAESAEPPRDRQGRFASQEQLLNAVQRASRGVTSAPPEAGPATVGNIRNVPLSPAEAAVMQRFAPYLGSTPQAVWEGLGECETIDQYDALMARQKGRR